eukprot:4179399-Pyramimonas_sp.AAC.1
MTYFWKGEGNEDKLDNQRSMALASTVTKHHYRHIRQYMKDLIPNLLFSTQTGGRQHCSTDFNHLHTETDIRGGQQEGTRLGADHDRPQGGLPQ